MAGSFTPGLASAIAASSHFVTLPRKMPASASGVKRSRSMPARLKVGTTRPPDCFQAARYIDARIKLFCLEQSIIGTVELVSLDIQVRQTQTLPRSLVFLFMLNTNLAQPFAKRNGTRMSLERRTESFDGPFWRFVFDEELSVE